MKILTYNIWFDQLYMEERITEICKIIINNEVDIVSLQEVTSKSLIILKKYLSKIYYFSKYELLKNYDNVIISKYEILEIHSEKLPLTQMDREFHYIIIKYDNIKIKIIGIHLESNYSKGNDIKYKQLQHIFNNISTNCIIMGDTNIINDVEIPNNIKDIWIEYGKKDELKYTFDYINNSNIYGKYRSRLDRIYIDKNYKVLNLELVGIKEIDKYGVYPSDHFGILSKIDLM